MLERTVVAQRIICDGISSLLSEEEQGDISKVTVNNEMMKYCRNAHDRCRNFLGDNKKVSKKSVKEKMKSTFKNDLSREKDV